ncbi:hypothetical protein BDZ97DRAFT_1912226 [Flammula alnicola]|nr:hypothetical protein BDZ97DRAFT_1912226 [Flammula alnicola]
MARSEFIDDLIPLILEADNWWPRDLVALSTVSPSWLLYIRRRLYPYPIIQSFPAARLLARTLTENPALTSLVTGICLRPMVKDPFTRTQPAELKALRFLLSLEGLTSIALGGQLSIRAERLLRLIAYPDILQDLHIDGSLLGHHLTSRPSLEWDESLAFAFPNLRKLRLTEIELDITPPSILSASSISSLIVENVHILSGHLHHLLNGAKALDRLHITSNDPAVSDEQLRLVLASCAVGCLHYNMRKDTNLNRFLLGMDSDSVESLRCLHLDGVFVDLGVLWVVEQICRNLVEFVVSGRTVRVSSDEWAHFIRSGALSSLRRLGLPWGTNIPPFMPWSPSDSQQIRDAYRLSTLSRASFCLSLSRPPRHYYIVTAHFVPDPMQSILSRHNSNSHRTPRKSSSFLSLRREKDKSSFNDANPSPYDNAGPSNTSPSSYFDVYPRPKPATVSRSLKSRISRSSPSSNTPPQEASPIPYHDPVPRYSDVATNSPTYAFPSFDPDDESSFAHAPLANGNYSRTRSRTGPSGRSKWEPTPAVPQLRFSNSSSTQHTETPPRTPDDYTASSDSLDLFPVVVAAPVAGVETMDALVDGMNGGDGLSSSRRSSNRSRFGIPNHHPLYQPPLPTPPPGIVLGGGKARPRVTRKASTSGDSSEDEDAYSSSHNPPSRTRRRRIRPPSRTTSNSTITPPSISPILADETIPHASVDHSHTTRRPLPRRPSTTSTIEYRKSVVPSISEIIRNHAPLESQVRSRPPTIRSTSLYSPSNQGHAIVHEEPESEPEPLTREEEAELLSRSSIDSVADEVQRTIRNQSLPKPLPPPPPSSASAFIKRYSTVSDNASSIYSPRSDPGAHSIYSLSAPSSYIPPSPLEGSTFLSMVKSSPSHAVAQYLRSSRLTTLLKLTRSPHASQDNPLTVSLSDLGSPTGYPVVVFLGLGCVRHIMGLYDEMADCMGLRLITIDRWGLGRTEPRSKSAKGIMQWASVVEEVLDLLHIDQCSIMAHSAGAPYALSFANKLPSRIRGDICLLAHGWEAAKAWLKYVPNSILKTAQAAEWKIQAWMIGKPPTIAYEGIGYTAPTVPKSTNASPSRTGGNLNVVYPSNTEARPRPSVGSSQSTFSEYDDLGDFEGRFESRSTLGLKSRSASTPQYGTIRADGSVVVAKRKTSRGILERLKGSSTSPSQTQEKQASGSSRKLKGLRSMGSLKSKSREVPKSEPPSPQLPPALRMDIGLGLEDLSWTASIEPDLPTATPHMYSNGASNSRSGGRRSISFTSSKAAPPPSMPPSMPGSPSPSTFSTTFVQNGTGNHQVALGNALIAASHAESAKGTHNDLLQILNHENHSWGFSYASYPHKVRVWYGDKDEKIAENAVRWMERTMGPDRCSVKVVKGADHGLMYRSSAVVDVLEWIVSAWRTEDRIAQPYSGLH